MPHVWRFYAIRYRGGNDSGNEASLAEIGDQKEGRPDGRGIGRDFPTIVRKSWTNQWELPVPDARSLIAAKNASFFGDFRRF